MAKKIKTRIKMKLPGGSATAAPPVGSMLGQHREINMMDFCKKFNEKTVDRKGSVVAVEVTIYTDKTYSFSTKLSSVAEEIKKRIGLTKGSVAPGKNIVGKISRGVIDEIAKFKMPDLTADDLVKARKIIEGSARSMGVAVVD